MYSFYVACNVWGEDFAPGVVERETGIVFKRKNEVGDIASIGRYRNQPRPYGSGTLVLRERGETGEMIPLEGLRLVGTLLEHFERAGGTDITIDVVVAYGNQCNLEISPECLKILGDLGLPLTISCYEEETLREE